MTTKGETGQPEALDTITTPMSPKKQGKEPRRYEELKIKSGPLYNLMKPRAYSDDNDVSVSADSAISESDVSSAIELSPLPAESTALLIVDVQPESVTIEITGNESKVQKFLALMENFGVQELTRTGKVALARK